MAYLVTFDTGTERHENLVTAIKAMGDWGALTPASYVLDSERGVRAIIEALQPMLGPKDSLAVLTISSPWAAYCDPVVEDMAETLLGKGENYIPKDWNGVDRS